MKAEVDNRPGVTVNNVWKYEPCPGVLIVSVDTREKRDREDLEFEYSPTTVAEDVVEIDITIWRDLDILATIKLTPDTDAERAALRNCRFATALHKYGFSLHAMPRPTGEGESLYQSG